MSTTTSSALATMSELQNLAVEVDAPCLSVDPEAMFPHRKDRARNIEAKKVCAGCPIIDTCCETALATGERFGVWGGTTETERFVHRRRLRGVDPAGPSVGETLFDPDDDEFYARSPRGFSQADVHALADAFSDLLSVRA